VSECNHLWRAISDRQYQCAKCGEGHTDPDPKDARITELTAALAAANAEITGYVDANSSLTEHIGHQADEIVFLRARVAELEGALEYTLKLWEGSMEVSADELQSWLDKAKTAILKEVRSEPN
jgi:hypothetical protein